MLYDEVDQMLEYADDLLKETEHELERSQEDVVTHQVCMNARQCIANYLASFLVQRDLSIVQPVTLQGLLDQCRDADERFSEMNLTPIHCRCEANEEKYCLNLDQVECCIEIARKARSVVMAEIEND